MLRIIIKFTKTAATVMTMITIRYYHNIIIVDVSRVVILDHSIWFITTVTVHKN